MSRIEDEIIKQLHLCVALMSDPLIMREQSVMVADQFNSAMNKIEQLQIFLRPPDDPCARHGWLDSSILTVGIKRMVGLVLAKQMEPLRWKTPKQLRSALRYGDNVVENSRNAAPQIFERGFKNDAQDAIHDECDETLMARDIKETNCMASLVLLYYYLNWHILLIMLNYINHPCIGGRESEAVLDFDKLLKGLPQAVDTFELRPIREFMHMDHTVKVPTKEESTTSGSVKCESSDDDGTEMGSDTQSEPDLDEKRTREPMTEQNVEAYILRVRTLLNTILKSEAMSGYMSSVYPDDDMRSTEEKNNKSGKHRKGGLVSIYRMIMGMTHRGETSNSHMKNLFAACFGVFDVDFLHEKNKLLKAGKLSDAIMLTLTQSMITARCKSTTGEDLLNCKVFSVYNLQEDTQRWFDMYKPIEISCVVDDDGKEFGVQPTQKKYTHILANILDNAPYNPIFSTENMGYTKMLCINDFNMASLMMDVSKSYLKLYSLISELRNASNNHEAIRKKLYIFIIQTYASDKSITKFIKSEIKEDVIDTEPLLMRLAWLSIPAGNHKKNAYFDNLMFNDYVIDESAGHYWGSKLSNFNSLNHRYFAWPGAETGDYVHVMKIIQSVLAGTSSSRKIHQFMIALEPGLRNSLFIHPMAESLLMLIKLMGCSTLIDNTAVRIKDTDTIHGPGVLKKHFQRLSTSEAEAPPEAEPTDPVDQSAPPAPPAADRDGSESETESTSQSSAVSDVSEFGASNIYVDERNLRRKVKLEMYVKKTAKYDMNKSKLVADLQAELSALSSRVNNVSRFKLYGGTSWPIVPTEKQKKSKVGNVKVFGIGKSIPRVISDRLTNAVEYIADMNARRVVGGA